ncbi:Uncharacterised protein family (UPF0167) [Shewanella putrefaciens]|nr:Uncharacterised protein family (UPF0167) [Shewanella putrefaciens]
MDFPQFTYHPHPLDTGAVIASDATCECCGQARGFICSSGMYCRDNVEAICPWCVADGSAADKFNGHFVDDYPLLDAGLDLAIVKEVAERTPGYVSWQQEVWQSHCNDACEFHGDAELTDLQALQGEALEGFLSEHMLDSGFWQKILSGYRKGGDLAIYKFQCRHCHKVIFTMDCN